MRNSQEVGLIRKYLRFGLILLILAVLVLAASAFIATKHMQEKADEVPLNNSSSNITSHAAASNDTNKTTAGPITIPLEKPPFIN